MRATPNDTLCFASHRKGIDTMTNTQMDTFGPGFSLDKIRNGDSDWESMVPEKVAKIIRNKRLFDYRG